MVTVFCGIGGDWEFERDRYLWAKWIRENVSYAINPLTQIKPHKDAGKAVIEFESEVDETMFVLSAPKFITYEAIQKYRDRKE